MTDVGQADRDISLPFLIAETDIACARLRHLVAEGEGDSHPVVQAFARHRIAAEQAQSAALAAMQAKLDAANELLRRFSDAVGELPVEDMVEADRDGDPMLVGYAMQAQGEWDNVRRAKDATDTHLKDTTP